MSFSYYRRQGTPGISNNKKHLLYGLLVHNCAHTDHMLFSFEDSVLNQLTGTKNNLNFF